MPDQWEYTLSKQKYREAHSVDVDGEIVCRKSKTDGQWYVVRASGTGWLLTGRKPVSAELAKVLEAGKPA